MLDLMKFESIQATEYAPVLTKKYAFIPTMKVVNLFQDMGWFPDKASQVKARKEETTGFQKHLIRFRREHFEMIPGNIIPEIVLTNAHDGAASFKIMAGLFRIVCSNGLIVADSLFANHIIKHMGFAEEAVKLAIDDVVDSIPRISGRIDDFRAIEMTPDDRGVFGAAALQVKYGEKATEFNVAKFMQPKRKVDELPTLWNAFNIAQEHLTKGGRFKTDSLGRKAKEVKSIGEDVRINRALWQITEHFATLKLAA